MPAGHLEALFDVWSLAVRGVIQRVAFSVFWINGRIPYAQWFGAVAGRRPHQDRVSCWRGETVSRAGSTSGFGSEGGSACQRPRPRARPGVAPAILLRPRQQAAQPDQSFATRGCSRSARSPAPSASSHIPCELFLVTSSSQGLPAGTDLNLPLASTFRLRGVLLRRLSVVHEPGISTRVPPRGSWPSGRRTIPEDDRSWPWRWVLAGLGSPSPRSPPSLRQLTISFINRRRTAVRRRRREGTEHVALTGGIPFERTLGRGSRSPVCCHSGRQRSQVIARCSATTSSAACVGCACRRCSAMASGAATGSTSTRGRLVLAAVHTGWEDWRPSVERWAAPRRGGDRSSVAGRSTDRRADRRPYRTADVLRWDVTSRATCAALRSPCSRQTLVDGAAGGGG